MKTSNLQRPETESEENIKGVDLQFDTFGLKRKHEGVYSVFPQALNSQFERRVSFNGQ